MDQGGYWVFAIKTERGERQSEVERIIRFSEGRG